MNIEIRKKYSAKRQLVFKLYHLRDWAGHRGGGAKAREPRRKSGPVSSRNFRWYDVRHSPLPGVLDLRQPVDLGSPNPFG